MIFKKLVFSGGGIKSIAFIGALKVLEKHGLLKNIESYIGCSGGAIIALFVSIGYTPHNLFRLFTKVNFADFQELQVDRLLSKNGMDSGQKIMKLFTAIVKRKGIYPNITFQELFQKTQKELIICGSNLTKNKERYFNYHETPNVIVLEALRLSISYPYIYEPIILNEDVYVDGGLLDPFPIRYYGTDCPDVLGILIHDRLLTEERANEISSIEDLSFSIISSVVDRLVDLSVQGMEGKFIQIDIKDFHSMDFKKGQEEKDKIYQIGINSAEKYLADFYHKKYQHRLLKKYLQIWREKVR